jgi:PAS domain-containing protein
MSDRLPVPRERLAGITALILHNHCRWTGRELAEVTAGEDPVDKLFHAPCVVLAAVGQPDSDHVFCYANAAALTAFETTWDGLIGLPSSASAEPVHRDERRRLLDEVGRRGFIEDYSGIRISRKGRRFRILRATVFNLLDEAGRYAGQAATFTDREDL